MFKKTMYLSFLVAISFAVIMPINSVSAASNLSSETVITTENVHEVLEYLNVNTSNYNDAEIEKKVESNPELTVGEAEKAITTMKQAPEDVNVELFPNSAGKANDNNLRMEVAPMATGTKTVTRTTLQGGSYEVTYSQSARYSSTRSYDAWEQAYGADASVSDAMVDGVSYQITSETFSSKVESPGLPSSNLNLQADLTVTGYLWGVKIVDNNINANINWDASYIYS